jgi:hypothetical protein
MLTKQQARNLDALDLAGISPELAKAARGLGVKIPTMPPSTAETTSLHTKRAEAKPAPNHTTTR